MPRIWYATEVGGARQFAEADSLPQALLRLRARGVRPQVAGVEETTERSGLHRVPWRLLTSGYEQLAGMLEQETPLDEALRRIAREAGHRGLSRSLSALADEVEQGRPLSEAMAQQPKTYSPVVRASVRAGEQAGDLTQALCLLARQQHDLARLASGMAFPLIYPVVICSLAFSILVFVASFIFPKFMQLYVDLGMESSDLPLSARAVMALHSALPLALLALLVVAGLLVVFWVWARRTRHGNFSLGLARLRVPIFGEVALYTALARFASTLAVLLRGGVETVAALRLSRSAANEPAVTMALRRAEAAVESGGRIVDGLRETGALPDEFTFRLGAAEARGDLTAALDSIADEYTRYADQLARRWVLISGPVIVVMLALVIGFIVFAMFSPMVGIVESLSQ